MFKAAPSVALSESRGTIRRRTECSRNLAKMKAVGTLREHSERYRKDEARPPRPAADL